MSTPSSILGRVLGHYRIQEKIGAGGMGEVYRAHDEHLGRDVAIKILPDALASEPERLARFQREARLLASLNHPSIAAIHGLEEADGTKFLVLELVEGQTLAERLVAGPLPLDEALTVCRQIAEALEAAHERGIIHRDLKPANVKVTPEGKVKVLDFGLAKAFVGDPATDLSKSPTASYGSSQQGVILGTAAYMSPEQARGKPLDKRSDVRSFGCVLYETLTSRQAFRGETFSDTIAAILRGDPDWTALPAATPPGIQLLLRRCLQKDPARRLHDIADARIEIEEDLSAPAPAWPAAAPALARSSLWRRAVPWTIAALALVISGLALWTAGHRAEGRAKPVKRFALVLTEPLAEPGSWHGSLALSPDGTRLVYAAGRGSERQLYLRPLDQLEAKPIPATLGALGPFFSPDGQWVGFFADGKLKKVSVLGGEPLTVCDAPVPRGGAWGADGTIYFATFTSQSLLRVPDNGGMPEPFTPLDAGEYSHRFPQALPGGRGVLFTILSGQLRTDEDLRVAVFLPAAGKKKVLLNGGFYARYVPTGHLVYARGRRLLAVPFDLERLEVTGKPVALVEGLRTLALWGTAEFSVATTAHLSTYQPQSHSSSRWSGLTAAG